MPRYRITKKGYGIIVGNLGKGFVTWIPFPKGRAYLRDRYGELKSGLFVSFQDVKVMKSSGYLSGPDPWKDQPELVFPKEEENLEVLDPKEVQKLWFDHIQSHPELDLTRDFDSEEPNETWFDHIVIQPDLPFNGSATDEPPTQFVDGSGESLFKRLRKWFFELFK